MRVFLRFLRTLTVGRARIARLIHAMRLTASSPAKSNISLEQIRVPDQDIATAVERYITNAKLAKYYTEMMGGTYLNFLQPFNGHGSKALSRFDVRSVAHVRRDVNSLGENQLDLIVRFMNELWDKVRDEGSFQDLRKLFEDYRGEIYLDHAHFSDTGQDLIAKKISEAVLSADRQIGTRG